MKSRNACAMNPASVFALLCFILVMVFASGAVAGKVTVCQTMVPGCDANTIQEGVNKANPGDVIFIRSGTYSENVNGPGTSKQGIALIGEGFGGGVTVDGSGIKPVFRGVSKAAFVNLTIQNGRTLQSGRGGGIEGADLLILGCTIRNNTADFKGGGISVSGVLIIDGSEIYGNSAEEAGGVDHRQGNLVVISGSKINNNTATDGSGGGIVIHGNKVIITGSEVSYNQATGFGVNGGGIATSMNYGTELYLYNSEVSGNILQSGNYAYGGGIAVKGELVMKEVAVKDNVASATSAVRGGGIYYIAGCQFGKCNGLEMDAVYILNNTAMFGQGGGLYETGSQEPNKLKNVTIIGNNADEGAGIYRSVGGSDSSHYKNITIIGNTAGVAGGGIYCASIHGKMHVSGAVIGNTPDQYYNCDSCSPPGAVDSTCNTGLQGECVSGSAACRADNVWGECVPATKPNEVPEDCSDTKDNDCDGKTDAKDPECQPKKSASNYNSSIDSNEPVNTFTGEFFSHYEPDIYLDGPLPVYFSRYYASGLADSGVTGFLGTNWRHNFEWTLTDYSTSVEIVNHEGRIITFEKAGILYKLSHPLDIAYQLVKNGGDYILGDPAAALVYTFDSTGKLKHIGDANANKLVLTYTGTELTSVTDGLGRTLTFSYTSGKLTGVTDGTRTVGFQYTGDHLMHFTDARLQTTDHAYNPDGRMTSWTLPKLNTPYTQTYYADGRVETQTDDDGNLYTFIYNDVTGETTINGPLGTSRKHTHNRRGEATANEGQDGISFNMGYDSEGRRSSITDRLSDTTEFTYHKESGKLSSEKHADGRETTYSYVPVYVQGIYFYKPYRIDHPDGTFQEFVYDLYGNLTNFIDRRGNLWQYLYNGRGQVLTAENPEGGVTEFTYNPDGTLLSIEDPAGNVISYGYDSLGRLELITYPDTPSTTNSFTYDNADNILTATDGRSHTTEFTYDENGNLHTVKDRLLKTTTYEYDLMDRLMKVTDPLLGTDPVLKFTRMEYDEFERLKKVTDRNNNTVEYRYDDRGRLTSIFDGDLKEWKYGYDAESVVESSTDPLLKKTDFITDEMGRTTKSKTPLGIERDVTYDSMGMVTKTENHLLESTDFTYIEGLLSKINTEGLTASYLRNALGQIEELTDPNTNIWFKGYDTGGRMVTSTDPLTNSNSYDYDALNRLWKVTFPGGVDMLTILYDENGNVKTRQYSSGPLLNYSYDFENRLTGAAGLSLAYNERGDMTDSNGLTIVPDDGGRMWKVTYAPGKTVTYEYNGRNLVNRITDWTGGITTFSYDDAGRLTGINRPNNVNASFGYDDDGRLDTLGETDEGGSRSGLAFKFDDANRIETATRNVPLQADSASAVAMTLSCNAAHEIDSFTYDTLGRLVNDGTRTYEWNLASRLTSSTEGASTVTYTYDGLGNRISRTEGGVTRDYVWNYAFGLPSVATIKEGGADLRYYIYTPGGTLLYSMEASDNSRIFYHYDETGNAMYLTDDSGSEVAAYAYTPYGELLASSGSADNPFTWQGASGVIDEGNGLYYMRARYYDSETGRFISRDPLSSIAPVAFNPYQYAWNNPLAFSDATGLTPMPPRGRARPCASKRDTAKGKSDSCSPCNRKRGFMSSDTDDTLDKANTLVSIADNVNSNEAVKKYLGPAAMAIDIGVTSAIEANTSLNQGMSTGGTIGRTAGVAAVTGVMDASSFAVPGIGIIRAAEAGVKHVTGFDVGASYTVQNAARDPFIAMENINVWRCERDARLRGEHGWFTQQYTEMGEALADSSAGELATDILGEGLYQAGRVKDWGVSTYKKYMPTWLGGN